MLQAVDEEEHLHLLILGVLVAEHRDGDGTREIADGGGNGQSGRD
jgi:hypothetical protein